MRDVVSYHFDFPGSEHLGALSWVWGQFSHERIWGYDELHVNKVWAYLSQAPFSARCEYYYGVEEFSNSRIPECALSKRQESDGKNQDFDFGRYDNKNEDLYEHDIPCVGQVVQVIIETNQPVINLGAKDIHGLIGSGVVECDNVCYLDTRLLQKNAGSGKDTVYLLGKVEGIWISKDCFEYELSYASGYWGDDSFQKIKNPPQYSLSFERAVLTRDRGSMCYSLLLPSSALFADYEHKQFIRSECVAAGTVQEVIVVGDAFMSKNVASDGDGLYAMYEPMRPEKKSGVKKSNSF